MKKEEESATREKLEALGAGEARAADAPGVQWRDTGECDERGLAGSGVGADRGAAGLLFRAGERSWAAMRSRCGGRDGFALIVAVGVLIVIVLSGIVLQRVALVELDDVRLAVGRTHARLAAAGGYEAGLAEIGSFLQSGDTERTIQGTIGENAYRATLRKTTAAGVGPALGWLPPNQPLIALSIEGLRQGKGKVGAGGRTYSRSVTAVVDPAKVPYQTVLWMNE